MYKKVSTDMNFVGREKEVEAFWKEHDIFQKSMEEKEGCPEYTFYDGPPTANGKPHIGHVLTRVIKDMIPRYRTMKGYKVPRKAGWDTHGLPVELEVEKLLGLDGKDQIEGYGLEPFIDKCKESVWKYKGMWWRKSHRSFFWSIIGTAAAIPPGAASHLLLSVIFFFDRCKAASLQKHSYVYTVFSDRIVLFP